MTEQEAIKLLKIKRTFNNGSNADVEAIDMAISALEEIQQYRALGTVEDIKKIINFLSLDGEKGLIDDMNMLNQYRMLGTVEEFKNCKDILSKAEADELSKVIDEWLLYQKIGKVEEIQEAMEKQIAKKVIETDDKPYGGKCPCCGEILHTSFMDTNYCHWCGNKLTGLE